MPVEETMESGISEPEEFMSGPHGQEAPETPPMEHPRNGSDKYVPDRMEKTFPNHLRHGNTILMTCQSISARMETTEGHVSHEEDVNNCWVMSFYL